MGRKAGLRVVWESTHYELSFWLKCLSTISLSQSQQRRFRFTEVPCYVCLHFCEAKPRLRESGRASGNTEVIACVQVRANGSER
eukprot:68800-Rhodomonas_salina.1